MMELLKIINQDLHYRKALDRLFIQFPEIKDKGVNVNEKVSRALMNF